MDRTKCQSGRLWAAAIILLSLTVGACARDPLDPRGALDHQAVSEIVQAEQRARSRLAYERARHRVAYVERGMSISEVEIAMEALVVIEGGGEDERPRKKLVEGRLCITEPSPLRQRWLFGYDEAGVELVGFALDFGRDDPEDDDWTMDHVDHAPEDDCPDAEGVVEPSPGQ